VRALKKLALSGAAALALLGGTVAGASVASAAPAVAQTTSPAAANLTNPNEFGVIYGPYSSRGLCEVNLFRVGQDSPPPISTTNCYEGVAGPWYFIAYYEV
jgi:hypothetical protein